MDYDIYELAEQLDAGIEESGKSKWSARDIKEFFLDEGVNLSLEEILEVWDACPNPICASELLGTNDPIFASRVYASRQSDLFDVAHDMFNDLMDDYRKELKEHTADDIIISAIPQYISPRGGLSDIEQQTIISLIYDIVDDYFSEYFGASSRNKYGAQIDEAYHGQIITKRFDKANDRYPAIGLRAVQEDIGLPPSTTVKALEGMCFNNEACEISDSEYFVGSYEEYNNL